MGTSRKIIDWEAIEREFRAGQLSNIEIGKNYGVSEGAIRKRAKRDNWKKDLSQKVKKAVREKLVRTEVRIDNVHDKEIIEEAAERGATVVKLHRRDIHKSQSLVGLLQGQLEIAATSRDELEDEIIDETNGSDGSKPNLKRRGQLMKAVSLPAHSGVLRDLSVAQKNLIYLERQAYNLDETGSDTETIEDRLRRIVAEAAG